MYSQKKIQATLDAFAASEGWMPTPHTLDEVNEFKAEIDSVVTIHSNSKCAWIQNIKPISAKRQKEVRRFIENEQALCAIDSGYFETRYAYLMDEYGVITKFQNRKSQDIIDFIIADLEERDLSVELLIIGSRQQGIEKKILLKLLHRTLFVPYTQSLMASVTHEKSGYMGRFIDEVYNNLPWWLIPISKSRDSFDNRSRIISQSAMQKTGLAQGWTPTFIFMSGVEYFPEPHKTIEEGLLRAVHSNKNTFLALYSNKIQKSSWLDSMWRYAKEYYPQGKSRLCPVFIPWFLCDDIYSQDDWNRLFPIPNKWKQKEDTKAYVKRCESYMNNDPMLVRIFGENWSMPLKQQWYYEHMYNQEVSQGDKRLHVYEDLFALPDEDRQMYASDSDDRNNEIIDTDNLDLLFPNTNLIQEKVSEIRRKANL